MAEVFLARSLRPDQGGSLFAVKRTLPDLSKDRDFASMFIDEASIARGLAHPHICQIHDQGEVLGQLYIAMEFIHGKDLKVVQHRMRERKEVMPYRYTAFALARIAQALDFAHQKRNAAGESEGIVHRDVSPQNVLLSYDGVPKLIDFGIAKAKSRLAQTQVGILKGKLAYMSPEQASGQEIDHRADVFALGIVLYELVTGRSPFKGSSDWSTLQRLSSGRHQPPRDLTPDLPARLDAILARALAPSLRERYDRAADMAADLDAYCEEDGREVSPASLSAFMRKLFRDDYIREAARIRTFLAIELPGRERAGARAGGDTVDVTVVAPSFIEPGQDSHDRDGADRKPEAEVGVADAHTPSTPRPAPVGVATPAPVDGFVIETDEHPIPAAALAPARELPAPPPERTVLAVGALRPSEPAPAAAPAHESTLVLSRVPVADAAPAPSAPPPAHESTLVLSRVPVADTAPAPSAPPPGPDPAGFDEETDEVALPAPVRQEVDSTPVEPPGPLGGFGNERTVVLGARVDGPAAALEAGPPPPPLPASLGHDVLIDDDAPHLAGVAAPSRPRDDLDTATVVEPEAGSSAPPPLAPIPLAPMPLPILLDRAPSAVATPGGTVASDPAETSAERPRTPTPMPRSRVATPAPPPRTPIPMPRPLAPAPAGPREVVTTRRRRRTRVGMTVGELFVLVGAAVVGAGIVLSVYYAGGRWPW